MECSVRYRMAFLRSSCGSKVLRLSSADLTAEGQEKARKKLGDGMRPLTLSFGVTVLSISELVGPAIKNCRCHQDRPWRQGGISFAFREPLDGGRPQSQPLAAWIIEKQRETRRGYQQIEVGGN